MTGTRFGGVLLRQAGRIGQRRVATIADRLAERIAALHSGLTAEAEPGRVRLMGRGLRRRWLTDARLRWLGRLLR